MYDLHIKMYILQIKVWNFNFTFKCCYEKLKKSVNVKCDTNTLLFGCSLF